MAKNKLIADQSIPSPVGACVRAGGAFDALLFVPGSFFFFPTFFFAAPFTATILLQAYGRET